MNNPKPPLARLIPVPLRDYWSREDHEFTPWLAQKDNLDLLAEALGLAELELEATEKFVGPFRADILCREIGTDDLVLVENQLERTDHCHLGQILTYAAGLGASKVVWVAPEFTEQHRAALDWLNRVTDESFHCFGVQLELWSIGGSTAMAPRFHVVAKPNDWGKQVRSQARQAASPAAGQHYRFWSQLRDHIEAAGSRLAFGEPTAKSMARAIAGPGRVLLIPWNVLRDGTSGIWVRVAGAGGDQAAAAIQQMHRESLTAALSPLGEVVWFEPDGRGTLLSLRRTSKLHEVESWPELSRWFGSALERLTGELRPIAGNG